VFGFLITYKHIFKVFNASLLYLTPGQTFFGILKYAPFILLGRLCGKGLVLHLHGNYLGKEYQRLKGVRKRIFHYLISKSSAGIVLSNSLKENFKGLLSADKVFIVENFVADEIFAGLGSKSVNTELNILYLSNLMREKGILDLLEGLRILKEEKVPFKATLAGDIEEEIKNEIYNYLKILAPEVQYKGVLKGKDKLEALKTSTIFALPTYYIMEGQPISILEAMAAGHVILTTRHAGIPDVVSEENALFVNSESPKEIANKLLELYQNPIKFEQMFVNNRMKADLCFREARFGEDIYNVLVKSVFHIS